MAMLRLSTKPPTARPTCISAVAGLDIGTGHALNAVQFNRQILLHPDNGMPMSDIQIDDWDTMLVMAARCYEATGLGYIGVDLVLDNRKACCCGAQRVALGWPSRWPMARACCLASNIGPQAPSLHPENAQPRNDHLRLISWLNRTPVTPNH